MEKTPPVAEDTTGLLPAITIPEIFNYPPAEQGYYYKNEPETGIENQMEYRMPSYSSGGFYSGKTTSGSYPAAGFTAGTGSSRTNKTELRMKMADHITSQFGRNTTEKQEVREILKETKVSAFREPSLKDILAVVFTE